MTFAGHVAASSLVLTATHNPGLIIVSNLLLHPLLDSIPHAEWTSFPDSRYKMVLITVIDLLIALGLIWLMLDRFSSGLVILSILFGLWLDIVDPLIGRWLPTLRHWHQSTHTWPLRADHHIDWQKTMTGRTPLWLKLIIQYGLVLVAALALN